MQSNSKYPKQIQELSKSDIASPHWFVKLWKDSVGSKLISGFIILIISTLTGIIKNLIQGVSPFDVLRDLLFLKLELYLILIIIVIVIIVIWIINLYVDRNRPDKADFILGQIIGNITFKELFNSLNQHYVKLPKSLQSKKSKEINLLTCFAVYIRWFGIGIDWDNPGDQAHFLYYTVGPILLGYSLLERESKFSDSEAVKNDTLILSENGIKFYQLLNVYRTYKGDDLHEW